MELMYIGVHTCTSKVGVPNKVAKRVHMHEHTCTHDLSEEKYCFSNITGEDLSSPVTIVIAIAFK